MFVVDVYPTLSSRAHCLALFVLGQNPCLQAPGMTTHLSVLLDFGSCKDGKLILNTFHFDSSAKIPSTALPPRHAQQACLPRISHFPKVSPSNNISALAFGGVRSWKRGQSSYKAVLDLASRSPMRLAWLASGPVSICCMTRASILELNV